tara:strand:- start:179 stop:292 length:114 start_codon:yes stop_codon:yes gene_type:complete
MVKGERPHQILAQHQNSLDADDDDFGVLLIVQVDTDV